MAPARRTCGLAILLVAAGTQAQARDSLVETVSLNDLNMSAEGGEAKLYRLDRRCRITVVHYGEMGKIAYRFDYGNELLAAVKREFAYSAPPAADPAFKTTLRLVTTLADPDSRISLTEDFLTYRALFDARHVATCSSAATTKHRTE